MQDILPSRIASCKSNLGYNEAALPKYQIYGAKRNLGKTSWPNFFRCCEYDI